MTELLAFDVGDDIVRIIDLRTDTYDCYRAPRMADGARRILYCDGVVISFNGILYDMPELAKIAGFSDADPVPLKGIHCDMRVHACRDRWPPRGEEDAPILGPDLVGSLPTLLRQAAARPTWPSRRLRTKQLAGLPHGGRAVAKDHRSSCGQEFDHLVADARNVMAERWTRADVTGRDIGLRTD